MITRIFAIFAAALSLGGCATAGAPAESSSPVAADSAQTVAVNEAITTVQSATAPEATAPEEAQIEMIEAPPVAQADIPGNTPDPDERICRREVRTGTHRAVRVCRTRAEVESMERDSKDHFRDLHELQRQMDRAEQISRQ